MKLNELKMNAMKNETKNNERRVLPVTGHALTLLKQHAKIRNIHTNLVFPSKDSKDTSFGGSSNSAASGIL